MTDERLLRTIGAARLQRYEEISSAADIDLEILYRWNSSVSLALFDEIAVVEVALRNALSRTMVQDHGYLWFRRLDLFDDDTLKEVDRTIRSTGIDSLAAPDEIRHGKFVAGSMLGFWVKLLGKGSFQGLSARSPVSQRMRMIYDTLLWKPTLSRAFPGVSIGERRRVEQSANTVWIIRNRVAHHESVLWGIPLVGQVDSNGRPQRLSVSAASDSLRQLAGYIDEGLADWLAESNAVSRALNKGPLSRGDFGGLQIWG